MSVNSGYYYNAVQQNTVNKVGFIWPLKNGDGSYELPTNWVMLVNQLFDLIVINVYL